METDTSAEGMWASLDACIMQLACPTSVESSCRNRSSEHPLSCSSVDITSCSWMSLHACSMGSDTGQHGHHTRH